MCGAERARGLLLACWLVAALAGCGGGEPAPPPVAVVAGEAISCSELRLYGRVTPEAVRAARPGESEADRARRLLDDLMVQRALAAEAVADGLDRDPEVVRRLSRAQNELRFRYLLSTFSRGIEIGPDEVAAEYAAHPERFRHDELISTRLILLEVPASADPAPYLARLEEIRRQALAGEADFGDLARRHSQAENARRGGVVAPSRRGALLAEFERVAWSLGEGQVSSPVLLPTGAALIKVDRVHPERTLSLEEATPAIERRLRRRRAEERRREAVDQATERWPPEIDWDSVLDPAASTADPVLKIGEAELSLEDLELAHRPPRLRGSVESAAEGLLLARLAAEDPPDELLRRLEFQRQRLLAARALDRRLETAYAEIPPEEVESAYRQGLPRFVARERRRFEVLHVPGGQGRMREARRLAEKAAAALSVGGTVPTGAEHETWGPLTRPQLSAATSASLARAAFELEPGRWSPALRLERYIQRTARFRGEGYVLLRVAEVTPERTPPLAEVADRIVGLLRREQFEALAAGVHEDVLAELGDVEVDRTELAACAVGDEVGAAPPAGSE